jgi:hypothetical protein
MMNLKDVVIDGPLDDIETIVSVLHAATDLADFVLIRPAAAGDSVLWIASGAMARQT